jgi:hypothetical protein
MSRNITRDKIRTRIQQRANLENHTNFVTTAELNDLINEAYCELWDFLVMSGPPDYYSIERTIATVDGTSSYALPADFFKLRAVFVDEGSGEYRPIAEVNEQERQYFRAPAGEYSVVLRYIPTCPLIVDDTTPLDGVNGWDDLLVIIGSIKCLEKEGTNTGDLRDDYKAKASQIVARAERNLGEPQRVLRRSLRYRDTFRAWANTVDAYRLRAGNIEIFRTAGSYLM